MSSTCAQQQQQQQHLSQEHAGLRFVAMQLAHCPLHCVSDRVYT